MQSLASSLPALFLALLLSVVGLGLSACSNEQIGRALGSFCHGADNCTAYNSDGTAVDGRWYDPY